MNFERKTNYYDTSLRAPLAKCKKCGAYTGERKMTKKPPTAFFVVCSECGHHTKGYRDQSSAVTAWNREWKDG